VNGLLKKIFGPKMEALTGDQRNCIMMSIMIHTCYLGDEVKDDEMHGTCGTFWEKGNTGMV
jgi:hypothetical protein